MPANGEETMHLSRIELDPRTARAPYQWHKALWELFPDRPADARDFLFRVEEAGPGRPATVLLQSAAMPQTAAGGRSRVLATRTFEPALPAGLVLRFRLRANPIRAIKDVDGRLRSAKQAQGQAIVKSCRVPLLKDDQQLDWLARKLAGAAEILNATAANGEPMHFRKPDTAPGKIVPCMFDGALRIADGAHLQRLLVEGIGPAKAFGCGLLSLARA